jgi:hypothetical protein
MPGNIVGEAWVAIRPDLTGFATALTAGLTGALTKGQAFVDTRPIKFRAEVDQAAAVAGVIETGSAMNAATVPIVYTVQINSAQALAELAAIRAIASLSTAGAAGGGGGGGITGAAAGAAAGGGGGGTGGLLTGIAAQKLLGVGAGGSGLRLFGLGAGLAGAFSILSFAGLGVEHVFTTILGLVGSLTGAVGGGLLLAMGAVGVAAAGIASDMLVMSSTLADSKAIFQGYDALAKAVTVHGQNSAAAKTAQGNLNFLLQSLGATPKQGATLAQAYSNEANAVALYGDNSKQAAKAQAQLTKEINAFGLQGVQAELRFQQAAAALNTVWDRQTQKARVAAVAFLIPFQSIAYTYIPLVAAAATTNFGIMTQAFKPLIAFISGQGTAVFKNLEAIFARNLPTAVDAFTQAIELLLKSINFLAPMTGGFTKKIDELLTKANSPSGFLRWEGIMLKLIGLWHTWLAFFVILTKDVVDFFKLTAGVGSAIVQALTGMLTHLHEWLNLTTTQTSLRNLFTLHKQEVLELLALLPSLLSSLGTIYLTVAPLLTGAMVTVLGAIANVLKAITSNAWGAWIVGLTLIASKLGVIGGLVAGLGKVPALLGKLFAGSVATTAATSALTIGKGVQPVFVTNWAMVGGGGVVSQLPGDVAKVTGGGLLSKLFLGTGTGVVSAIALPIIASAAFAAVASTFISQTLGRLFPHTGAETPVVATGAGAKNPVSGIFSDLNTPLNFGAGRGAGTNAFRNQQQVAADEANIAAQLVKQGVSVTQAAADAKIIEQAWASGKVKTIAQLQALIDHLRGIATDTEKTAFNTHATADIYYQFKNKQYNYLRNVTDDLLFQGLSTKNAAIGTSEIAQLWAKHKITTGGQMQLAVQNYIAMTQASGGIPPTLNQLEGLLAGTKPDLKKFAGGASLLGTAAVNAAAEMTLIAGILPQITADLAKGNFVGAGALASLIGKTRSGRLGAEGLIVHGATQVTLGEGGGGETEWAIPQHKARGYEGLLTSLVTGRRTPAAGRSGDVTFNQNLTFNGTQNANEVRQIVHQENRKLVLALRADR